MATNANLPSGAFLTTIKGKKCTAVPFAAKNVTETASSSIRTTSLITSTTETTSSAVSTTETTTTNAPSTSSPVVLPPTTSPIVATTTTPARTSTPAQTTTTSAAAQSPDAPANQAPVVSTTTTPAAVPSPPPTTQVTPPAQDVPAPSTTITTTSPRPETTQQPVQNPAPGPSPSTGTTTAGTTTAAVAPIVTGTTTADTVVAGPGTSAVVEVGVTTSVAEPATAAPADSQPQPTNQQPVSDIAATTSTNANEAVVPPAASETTTSTAPPGAPVLAGPGPSAAPDVVESVTSTNDQGDVIVAPTQSATPGQPVVPGSQASPVSQITTGSFATQTKSDTRPQETALPSLGSGGGMGPQATAAIAGGVAGTVVLLGVLAFLFFWRRRRRNSSGPPASPASTERGIREKQPYVITRNSIGPTPVSEKFKASLAYRYQEACLQVVELGVRAAEAIGLRKRTDAEMDRAAAQAGPLMSGGHSRNNSGFGLPPAAAAVPKREYPDWWDRLTEDEAQNWTIKPDAAGAQPGGAAARTNNFPSSARASSNVMGPSGPSTQEPAPPIPARRGPTTNEAVPSSGAAVTTRQAQPRQAAPSSHFMSNLGINLDSSDPFSDANSMSHVSAMVMPLAAPTGPDPFSDANAIPAKPQARGPNNYIQGVQHARRESRNTVMRRQQTESVYRESTISEESFQTRRDRVRSDPFDLDRPELRAAMPTDAVVRANEAKQPAAPRQAHMRTHSSSSSKYSTHTASESVFSEPGPDVGPAVNRKRSNGSQTSVGRAM